MTEGEVKGVLRAGKGQALQWEGGGTGAPKSRPLTSV